MLEKIPPGGLGAHMGIELDRSGEDWVELSMNLQEFHMRPGASGVHAGSVISLADSACGVGSLGMLPDGATGFITLELKSNLVGSAQSGRLVCRAEAKHLGRTTQVWHATVTHPDSGRKIALFQCTQLILWP